MKNNILKSIILSLFIVTGVSNVWGEKFTKGELIFYTDAEGDKNWYFETSTVGDWVIQSDVTTGFYLKRVWCNIAKESGNVCDNTYINYKLYKQDDPNNLIKEGNEQLPAGNWSDPVYFNKSFNNDDGINILDGVVGGKYVLQFYFTAKVGGDCNGTIYLSNNSSNYNIKFTYNPTYTVTVKAGTGGKVANSSVTAGNINAVTLPKATPNTGYSFDQWTVTSGDLTLANATSNSTATVKARAAGTVTANFKGNKYTVTFDNQSATTAGSTSVTATYGSAMPSAVMPKKTGYTFGGYYTSNNGGGTQYYKEDGSSARTWNITENYTLYAKWTATNYTITYNTNGGNAIANKTYTIETETFDLPTPTRTGYTFNGWYDNSGLTGNQVTQVTKGSTGNKTFYAKWEGISYTVKFDANGGSGSMSNQVFTYGTAQNLIANTFTRDGYMFAGWNTKADGSGNSYTNQQSVNNLCSDANGTTTLYAQWVEYAGCIFFKNNVGWENVYVYTFKDDVWGKDGMGVYPANRYEDGQMSKLGESDIYYYVLTNTTDGFNYIAFSEKDMSTYEKFYDTKAVYRGDRTDKMPLFIPQNKSNQTANQTQYYNEGIWMKYNSKESGYYLNIQNESSTALTAPSKGGYIFTATVYLAAGSGERTLDLTNLQDDVKFSKNQAMTTNSEIVLNKWDDYNAASTLTFTPSATGAYTFTLNLATGEVKLQATNPTIVTASEGDFRLIYVEQVVEKNSKNQTVITRKKMHPSDIIRKRTAAGIDIVSLHVYNMNTYEAIKSYSGGTKTSYTSPSNSEVILQRWDGTKWEDVEGQGHMVFGPLKTIPSMATLPSRRNADTENLYYDQGIANIIADEKYDLGKGGGNGVWNFPIVQDGSGNAHLDRKAVARYEGNYYIRTACAAGGWDAYRAESDNQMTYSQYAEGNKEFTHYYCKWVNLNKYVQFVVANNHSEAISDTLLADRTTLLGEALADNQIMVDSKGIVPEGANIRFSWKEWDNGLHRAYIGGSGEGDKDYLVLHDGSGDAAHHLWQFPTSNNRLTNNKQTFSDNGGWMYQADVYAQTGTAVKMTAKYPLKANSQTQYFKGTEVETVPLIGGGADDTEKYPIRVLYDFKENRLITAYVPQAPETEDVAIETDLMIIRKDHNPANQLTLNDKTAKYAINSERTAYGAITFTKDHLISNNWAVTNDKTFYWISFPFDVKLSDAFGFGKYATHWYIEWYDGESRAENGLFLDSGTYWRYVTKSQAKDFVLKANTGYVLWLNVPRIQSDNLFVGETKEISIYFPSMIAIDADFEQYENKNHTVAAHWRPEGSRRYNEDSNWNLIGVPSYANSQITTTLADGIKPEFLYTYLPATDTYDPQAAGSTNFQSMYAYMVQFAGTITWAQLINDHDPIPSSIAARQSTADEMHQPMLRVELQQNGKYADQTFVKMQAEDATNAFDMNKDLTKVINKTPNLYSITSDNVDVAGNVMPLAETIVPLGVDLQTAGEYTFAMPDGTEGMTIELIDYETNTRTNLLLDSYSVNLSAGANETRFALHIQPDKVATSVENIGEAKGDNVKKYIIDGKLYMQQGEVLYDAHGHIVR